MQAAWAQASTPSWAPINSNKRRLAVLNPLCCDLNEPWRNDISGPKLAVLEPSRRELESVWVESQRAGGKRSAHVIVAV